MAIIDGSFLTGLGFLFNKTVTIQEPSREQDEYGQLIDTWIPLGYTWETDEGGEVVTSGGEPIRIDLVHEDLPCIIFPKGSDMRGSEVRRRDETYVVASYKILLQGYYPAIRETMRAVSVNNTYEITLVKHDAAAITTTLFCEVVR